jgi:enoyl-[acyl-carrier protein] reductase II
MNNRIKEIFGIHYPIIQGGMVWCSGWRLASAVSNAGGLGLIGAGSMPPEVLREHIEKTKNATQKPFGVNLPLFYSRIEESIQTVIDVGVKIVFTSAGNPASYTQRLKDNGITVFHVIANQKFAKKCQEAGVDGIVAEGFEAGGHNGREETTTFTLIPLIREVTDLPLLAAGGIASGKSMLASMTLGADGVQVGTRFAASVESSAHDNFKQAILNAVDGSTFLSLKKLGPARMLKNAFWQKVDEAEQQGASRETLAEILGKGRSKRGVFEGDLDEGELEIGQAAALIHKLETANEIIDDMMSDFRQSCSNAANWKDL